MAWTSSSSDRLSNGRVDTCTSFGISDAMIDRYFAGSDWRHSSIAVRPWASKSSDSSRTKSPDSLLREPFGFPPGLPL